MALSVTVFCLDKGVAVESGIISDVVLAVKDDSSEEAEALLTQLHGQSEK